jgi:hypothetical protein
MSLTKLRYSAEDLAQRGDEIYDRQVRPHVGAEDHGKVVAIDVEIGSYAIGDTAVDASRQILSQHPDAQIWLVRVGERALHRIGSWRKREVP